MKLILLFMTIVIGVKAHPIHNSQNANLSSTDIKLCRKYWYGFKLDNRGKLSQSKCCDWSRQMKLIKKNQPEPCRPLFTTSIDDYENVVKVTCESGNFEYGCPFPAIYRFTIQSLTFAFSACIALLVVLLHRIQAPDDFGGLPLTMMCLRFVMISCISHLIIYAVTFYYGHLWRQQY